MVIKTTTLQLDNIITKSLRNKHINISSLVRDLLKTYNENLNKELNKRKIKIIEGIKYEKVRKKKIS